MTDAETYYRRMRNVTEFTVTEEHLKLLRRAYVDWEDCEFGAPAIDCKRPYGNSDVIADIGEASATRRSTTVTRRLELLCDHRDNFTKLHAEEPALRSRSRWRRAASARPVRVREVHAQLDPRHLLSR